MDTNRVTLVGNLGREPQIVYPRAGDEEAARRGPFVVLSLATERRGAGQDRPTDWHRVVVGGVRAVELGRALHQGDRVLVDGSYVQSAFTGREGGARVIWEVHTNVAGVWTPAAPSVRTLGDVAEPIEGERPAVAEA